MSRALSWRLSNRQQDILAILQRDRQATAWTLAACVDAPEASVRRDIGMLRHNGFNISYAEGTGMYRYYGY